MKKTKFHAAGALIIMPDNKVALFKRAGGEGFDLPFGKKEKGETPEQTARRECLEEVGIEIEIIDNIPHFERIMKKDKKYITFLAKPIKQHEASHKGEGELIVGPAYLLATGKYSEYNIAMLAHFTTHGINL